MGELPAGKESDKKAKKKNTSLRLDKDVLKRLKRVALEQDTSIQNIIENLIREYLEGRNSPPSGGA